MELVVRGTFLEFRPADFPTEKGKSRACSAPAGRRAQGPMVSTVKLGEPFSLDYGVAPTALQDSEVKLKQPSDSSCSDSESLATTATASPGDETSMISEGQEPVESELSLSDAITASWQTDPVCDISLAMFDVLWFPMAQLGNSWSGCEYLSDGNAPVDANGPMKLDLETLLPQPSDALPPCSQSPGTQKGKPSGRGKTASGRRARCSEKDRKETGRPTTAMLRNIPNNYSRNMLLELIDSEGFVGSYDFLYMPIDFQRNAGLGYAFINCVSHREAERFRSRFDGFEGWQLASNKVGVVSWGEPLQGLQAHIERYRNSPVMHEDVPDSHRPVLFCNGVRIPFPAATKKLRAPRLKRHHG